MNILFLSHTYIGCPYVVGSNHLSREMSKLGHKVAHISHPKTKMHALMGKGEAFDFDGEVNDKLYQYTPKLLVPAKKLMLMGFDMLLTFMLATKIKKKLKQLSMESIDICYIDDPIFALVVDHLNIKTLVYRPTDIYQKMDNGEVYARYEQQIVNKAEKVVGTNKNIIKYLNVDNQANFFYIDNGYDRAHFTQAQSQPIMPSEYIEIVYVGSLDSRFDLELVIQLVEQLDTVRVNVYSPDDKTSPHERIVYHGTADYQTLPSLLAQYHILLMPFNDIVSNHGRSPMKLFEYASTLRPIIMPSFMDGHGLAGVFQYRDFAELKTIVSQLDITQEYQRDDGILVNSSWEFKTKQLLALTLEDKPT